MIIIFYTLHHGRIETAQLFRYNAVPVLRQPVLGEARHHRSAQVWLVPGGPADTVNTPAAPYGPYWLNLDHNAVQLPILALYIPSVRRCGRAVPERVVCWTSTRRPGSSLATREVDVRQFAEPPIWFQLPCYVELVMLSRLIYFSQESDVGKQGIIQILDEAREGNKRDDITGVLAFDRRWFLQCLEGPRDALTRKFVAIARDPRHSEPTLIAFEHVSDRTFPSWTMGAIDVHLLDRDGFYPPSMTASMALETLRRLQAAGATM